MWAPKPEYSEQARKARLEGEVSLRCLIDEEGSARNCRVDRPAGLGLDEKAVAAVSQWKFSPGTRGGQRVAVEAGLKIAFRLPAMEAYQFPGIWDAAEFHPPTGASNPRIHEVAPIRVAEGASAASATLNFDIDEHGNAANLRVERSSDDGWAAEVTSALRKWNFLPAELNGRAIAASRTMDFVRGN